MQMGRCCKCDPAPPLPGSITRSVIPTAIADYESISTASWSSGSLTTLSGAYDSYYYHHQAANISLAGSSYIMDPIRYSIHEPSTAGATYDSVGKWDLYSGQFSNARSYGHVGDSAYVTAFPLNIGSVQGACGQFGLIDTLLPVSGNSHAVFDADARVVGFPEAGVSYLGSLPWVGDGQYQNSGDVAGTTPIPVPELAAIASSVQWAPLRGTKIYAIRHRVNGSAVGTLATFPVYNPSWYVTLAAGDTWEIDIWYQVNITKAPAYGNRAGKHAAWIPIQKTTGGSYYPPTRHSVGIYKNSRGPRAIGFSGLNFTPSFNAATQTYELAFSGGSPSWTLQNGTMTQKVATVGNGNDQWVAGVTQNGLSWRSPTNLTAVGQITMSMAWDKEHVHLVLYSSTLAEFAVYSPANTGDYITSTTSTEWGGCSWGPRGCFNQSGATTFTLRDHPFDGYKTGSLSSINTEWPTQCIVTRKAK